MNVDYSFPFRAQCEQCANEQLHHHTGERTKGMPHEGGAYYCWCLDKQEPEERNSDADTQPNDAA